MGFGILRIFLFGFNSNLYHGFWKTKLRILWFIVLSFGLHGLTLVSSNKFWSVVEDFLPLYYVGSLFVSNFHHKLKNLDCLSLATIFSL